MIGKALIACEESQEVCKRMRAKGWEAYSCDILPCSGGHPEWHIQGDMFDALASREWNFIGLHTPCTHTCVSGNKHYANTELRQKGINFTKLAWEKSCKIAQMVYLEQPKTIMQKYIGERSQIIHPWQFGHGEVKQTWLWLKGLPLLKPSKIVEGREEKIFRNFGPGPDRGKLRSKTYSGIAQAMADQWTDYYTSEIIGI